MGIYSIFIGDKMKTDISCYDCAKLGTTCAAMCTPSRECFVPKKGAKMKPNYYKFLVQFSLMGELEIQATSSEEAEDIVKNMSDREIEHQSDFIFETMELLEKPEQII